MEELIRQMKYIVNVGGEECLGLGSDFDGIEEAPQMRNGAGMQSLAEAMERAGMTCKLIERICYGNVKRFFERKSIELKQDKNSPLQSQKGEFSM